MSSAPDAGAERLHFKVGPFTVEPGQNNIATRGADGAATAGRRVDRRHPPEPRVRERQDAGRRRDPPAPRGVAEPVALRRHRLPVFPQRFFAVGEEKTNLKFPPGLRLPVQDDRPLAPQLHAPQPHAESRRRCGSRTTSTSSRPPSPAAKGISRRASDLDGRAERRDVPRVQRPAGRRPERRVHLPRRREGPVQRRAREERVDRRPGRHAALDRGSRAPGRTARRPVAATQRRGRTRPTNAKPGTTDTVHLFSSVSHYYEPAGPVSWDVTMSATPDNWRVQVHKGDKLVDHRDLRLEARVVVRGHGHHGRVDGRRRHAGTDPFTTIGERARRSSPTVTCPRTTTTAARRPTRSTTSTRRSCRRGWCPNGYVIDISNFVYASGDMSIATSVPTIKQGQSITFDNLDAPLGNGIWHTITDCAAPCDGHTGIAYPLANGPIVFDSGELGLGGPPASGHRHLVDADQPCRPAPTPTSAGSTRSCGVRSASSPTERRAPRVQVSFRRARHRGGRRGCVRRLVPARESGAGETEAELGGADRDRRAADPERALARRARHAASTSAIASRSCSATR